MTPDALRRFLVDRGVPAGMVGPLLAAWMRPAEVVVRRLDAGVPCSRVIGAADGGGAWLMALDRTKATRSDGSGFGAGDDEVLVAFPRGAPRSSYAVGPLWSSGSPPSEGRATTNRAAVHRVALLVAVQALEGDVIAAPPSSRRRLYVPPRYVRWLCRA